MQTRTKALCTSVIACLLATGLVKRAAFADQPPGWRALPVKAYLDKEKKIRFCRLETENHTQVCLLVVPINSGFELKPFVSSGTCTTSQAASEASALACVNAGFFNLHGGKSTGASASFVTVDGKIICSPRDNEGLIKNPKLQPYLEKIFNRSELRAAVNGKGKIVLGIQPHGEALPQGLTLKYALQAGPRLLPEITAREEAFLRTEPDGAETDSIGCMKAAARTAIGVTGDDRAIIVCVAGPSKDEFAAGMTLFQLADFMKKLGCLEAINFDGGASATMSIEKSALDPALADSGGASEGKTYVTVCGRVPETRVKSCLILKAK